MSKVKFRVRIRIRQVAVMVNSINDILINIVITTTNNNNYKKKKTFEKTIFTKYFTYNKSTKSR